VGVGGGGCRRRNALGNASEVGHFFLEHGPGELAVFANAEGGCGGENEG